MSLRIATKSKPGGAPIASRWRRLHGSHGIAGASSLLALCLTAGCASFDRSQVRATEQLLYTGGFTFEPADTPPERARLAALPKLQMVEQSAANGEKSYVFADPESCCCVFVGGPEEYARYEEIRARELRERSRDVEVALFGDSAMYAHVSPDYPKLLPLPAAAEGSGCRD